MHIQSIRLTNFQCYSGTDNVFEFAPGLNLVIGDNNAGKSKLYDAFWWTLYDEIFDSLSRKHRKTAQVKSELVSDKTKGHCGAGETVRAEVEMTVGDPEKGEAYILTRSYEIRKTDDGTNWQEPSGSDFSIFHKDANQNSKKLNIAEHEKALAKILPPDVKPYMWFQGEQVDSLIDFNNSNSLTTAINVLSDISEFDFYKKTAGLALETAEAELRRDRNRFSSDKKKNEDLENERTEISKKLERLEKEMKEVINNLTLSSESRADKLDRLEDAEKIRELDHRRKVANEGLKEANDAIKTQTAELQKGLFSKNWLAKDAGFLVDLFSKKYTEYQEKRMARKAEAKAEKRVLEKVSREFWLPPGVPEPPFIEGMLADEHCKVCDRPAPHGSEAFEKIKELLDRAHRALAPQPVDEPVFQQDFEADFKTLFQNGYSMKGRTARADEGIENGFKQIHSAKHKRKNCLSEIATVEQSLKTLLGGAGDFGVESAKGLVIEFKKQDESAKGYLTEKNRVETDMLKLRERLREKEEELKKLSAGKVSPVLEEKVAVLRDFAEVAKRTRDRVFNRLIERLEAEANGHFLAMTEENRAVRGRIKLTMQPNGNFMPRNLDSKGRELTNINDSNLILIKLAVIMAIISAKRNSPAAELYPLITDAATSKFSENYALGFYRAASAVYTQSICTSKDFIGNDGLLKRLLDEIPPENMGNVYHIESSVENGDREGRGELETHILKIR